MLLVLTAACVLNATHDTADYNLTASVTPAAAKAGESVTYELSIEPKGSWASKAETPFKADLSVRGSVALAKTSFANADVVHKDKRMSLQTSFTAAKGRSHIDAAVTFFLCTEQICQRFKDNVTLQLDVP